MNSLHALRHAPLAEFAASLRRAPEFGASGTAMPAMRLVSNAPTSELAYGPLSAAPSPNYNGYCANAKGGTAELTPPALEPDMLGKGLLNTSEGDPDPLRIQHIVGLVLAQNFPASNADWEHLSPDQKFAVIQSAVASAFETVGLPKLKIVLRNDLPGDTLGEYVFGSWKMNINRVSLLSNADAFAFLEKRHARTNQLAARDSKLVVSTVSRGETLDTVAHECQHAIQDFLMISWFAGHRDSELPERLRAYKDLILLFHRNDFPAYADDSALRQLAQQHPTRSNQHVENMMEGLWENLRLLELFRDNDSAENYSALYHYGLEGEAVKAGSAARRCLR